MRILRNAWRSLCNLWYWLPIIWGDRQWDHVFLVRILGHKLTAMEEFFKNDSIVVNSDKVAGEIRRCRMAAERIANDEYLSVVLAPHEKKWGEAEIIWKCIDDEHSELVDVAVLGLDDEASTMEKRGRLALYRLTDHLREQDYEQLFALMGKHIQGWWD